MTVNVGTKTFTENGAIALEEASAQDAAMTAAFESSRFQSGQIKIENGKMTITGTPVPFSAFPALPKSG